MDTLVRFFCPLALFFCCVAPLQGVEILGKVASVQDKIVQVAIDDQLLPNVGDKAEIVVEIPGLDDVALVASGKVADAGDALIQIAIDRAPGKITIGQSVRIQSEHPRTRSKPIEPQLKSNPTPSKKIQLVRKFESTDSLIAAVGFSTDSQTALTCSNGIRVWDIASGNLLNHIPFSELTEQAVFSKDRRRVLTGAERGFLGWWDASSGRLLRRFIGHSTGIQTLGLSPDGRLAASAAGMVDWPDPIPGNPTQTLNQVIRPILSDAGVRIWDTETGQVLKILEGHRMPVHSLTFSPNGLYLLTASPDRTMRLWDSRTGKEVVRYIEDEPMGMLGAQISPDGNFILSISQGAPDVEELDVAPSEVVVHHSGITKIDDHQPAHRLRLWDIATGKVIQTLIGHQHEVWGAIFSPDGKTILTGSVEKTVRFWDTTSGTETAKFDIESEYPSRFAFSPDGRYALVASHDGREIRVWRIEP